MHDKMCSKSVQSCAEPGLNQGKYKKMKHVNGSIWSVISSLFSRSFIHFLNNMFVLNL